MKKQAAQIKEFSELFGFNVHPEPQIPSAEIITLRDTLIREEVDELLEASKAGDIVEAADAIGDILYILLGTACEYGLIDKLEDVFDLIHGNNMKKVWPDGKVHKREDGKVLKPEGFEKVALSTLFETQIKKREQVAAKIPISVAKDIAHNLGYDEVIIVGAHYESGMQSVATYGKTLAACENAAQGGNAIKRLLKWPEELCNQKPARQKRKEKPKTND